MPRGTRQVALAVLALAKTCQASAKIVPLAIPDDSNRLGSRNNDSNLWHTKHVNSEGVSLQPMKELAMFFLAVHGGLGSIATSNAQTPTIPRHDIVMNDGNDRYRPLRRGILTALYLGYAVLIAGPGYLSRPDASNFKRLTQFQLQYIAALGDPDASSGSGADRWGLWEKDPGPRGVKLKDFEKSVVGGQAPAGWTFDESRWWLEEHGLIMETPVPLPLQKRYLVSGGRETTSILTVYNDGRWELDKGNLYDVTHLPCRAAVYTNAENAMCTPTQEAQKLFPVQPGAKMPTIDGCKTQDWQVLFVVGVEE